MNGINLIRVSKNVDVLKILSNCIVNTLSIPARDIRLNWTLKLQLNGGLKSIPWPYTKNDIALKNIIDYYMSQIIDKNGFIYLNFNGSRIIQNYLK